MVFSLEYKVKHAPECSNVHPNELLDEALLVLCTVLHLFSMVNFAAQWQTLQSNSVWWLRPNK